MILSGFTPYYSTELGDAYVADSLELLKTLPPASVNTGFTFPPYALHCKKRVWERGKTGLLRMVPAVCGKIFTQLPDEMGALS